MIVGFLLSNAVFGQTAASMRFEAASIKPVVNWPPAGAVAGGERGTGGGCPTSMKVDPGRVDFQCATLAMLIGYAFRISPDRVTGPDWMMAGGSPRFNIAATIPQGGSNNQVPEMVQALLAERFNLIVHRGTADREIYGLVVARGGLKVKEVAPQGAAAANADSAEAVDAFYGATLSRVVPGAPGSEAAAILSNPRMGTVLQTGDPFRMQRWEAPDITMAGLADLLDHVAPLPSPVTDLTGRGGRYQLVLEVSLKDLRPGQRREGMADFEAKVIDAFNDGLAKLGLRLERRRGRVENIFVDRVEKSPTDN